jgi:hypothetical protein
MWFIFIILFSVASGSTFLLYNEGWTIVGNKKIEDAIHQSYNRGSLSNYIMGSDNLVNIDVNNRDDKNLWYFKSPPITLKTQPFLLTFSITSLSGDFTKLNRGSHPVVKITTFDGIVITFHQVAFDGKTKQINVPFVKELWKSNRGFTFKHVFSNPFTIEILGDWTQRIETVAIDNVDFY